jgi:hypothetical protein
VYYSSAQPLQVAGLLARYNGSKRVGALDHILRHKHAVRHLSNHNVRPFLLKQDTKTRYKSVYLSG